MEATIANTGVEISRLEQERQVTLEKLDHLKSDLKSLAERSADETDTDAYEREKLLALAHSLQRKVESLDRAIELAQGGAYGICESCGDRIDPARLEVLPQATLCLRCQRELERRIRRGR